MMRLPLPPPYPEGDPQSAAVQLFSCVVVVLLLFETIVLVLPENWQRRVSELQFGRRWAERTRR